MVDPVGTTLGGVSMFKLIYDQCRSLYEDCQEMRSFGKDARLYSAKLRALQYTYDALMSNTIRDLQDPPDYENPDYEVTREIQNYLVIIQTHLKECQDIVTEVLKASQHVLTGTRSEDSGPSTTSSPTVPPRSRKRDSFFNFIHKVPTGNRTKKADKGNTRVNGDHADASRAAQDAGTNAAVGNGSTPEPRLTFDGQPIRGISKQDDESRQVRSNASSWTIIKWADHKKEDMDKALEKLRVSINDLMQYLKLRPLNAAGLRRNLGVHQQTSYKPRFHPSILARLHHSLTKINHIGDKGQAFSVSIAETGDHNHETLARSAGVQGKLRKESLVLFIQKLERHDQSQLLAIEAVRPKDGDATQTGWNMITDVADLIPPTSTETGRETSGPGFAVCGAIQDQSNVQTPHHHIFIETKHWQPSLSLSTRLDNPAFVAQLTTLSLIPILRHIMIAYLDFRHIRGPCLHPRLEDFLSFHPPRYKDSDDFEDADVNTLWPFPYWSCGFGKPPRHRLAGASRPPEEERGVSLLELGLVLYQLGSGSKRVYESDHSGQVNRKAAQKRALQNLKLLSDRHGLSFMHAVKSCLLGDAHTSDKEEKEIVCACLASLENLDVELR